METDCENYSVRPELAQSSSLHLLHKISHNLLLPAHKPIRDLLPSYLYIATWGKENPAELTWQTQQMLWSMRSSQDSYHKQLQPMPGYMATASPGRGSLGDGAGVDSLVFTPLWQTEAAYVLLVTDAHALMPSCHSSHKPHLNWWPRHGGIYNMFITQHLNTRKRKSPGFSYQSSELCCSTNYFKFSFIINNMAIPLPIFLFPHKVQCRKIIYSYLSHQVRKWDHVSRQIHKKENCFNKKCFMHKIIMFIYVNKYWHFLSPTQLTFHFQGIIHGQWLNPKCNSWGGRFQQTCIKCTQWCTHNG